MHLPNEIGCLTNLQNLRRFQVGTKRGRRIGELGSLSELGGEMEICDLQNVSNKEEAEGAKIGEKRKLEKLRYVWQDGSVEIRKVEEVLEGLEPHSNLKSLTIEEYMGGCCPSWLVSSGSSAFFQPNNLVYLKLIECKNLKNVPSNLGLCKKLKFLELKGLRKVSCIGNDFYTNDDKNKHMELFPSLEKFTLEGMDELEKWEWVGVKIKVLHVFPGLKNLIVRDCQKLSGVPMQHLSNPKVRIYNCPRLKENRA